VREGEGAPRAAEGDAGQVHAAPGPVGTVLQGEDLAASVPVQEAAVHPENQTGGRHQPDPAGHLSPDRQELLKLPQGEEMQTLHKHLYDLVHDKCEDYENGVPEYMQSPDQCNVAGTEHRVSQRAHHEAVVIPRPPWPVQNQILKQSRGGWHPARQ